MVRAAQGQKEQRGVGCLLSIYGLFSGRCMRGRLLGEWRRGHRQACALPSGHPITCL